MLELYNVLWVIPGFIFISLYNKKGPEKAINLSGWSYIFSLVLLAFLTWIPAEIIAEGFKIKAPYWVEPSMEDKISQIQTVLIAIFFSFMLLLLAQWNIIANMIFPSIYDNFYNKCVEWENEFVLLTLKNGKAYRGLLWKYPSNLKSKYESQTISIIPFKSGYRHKTTKKVIWNSHYPEYHNKSDLISMELIIPRSEIITFGKFNHKVFEHFELFKNSMHPDFI